MSASTHNARDIEDTLHALDDKLKWFDMELAKPEAPMVRLTKELLRLLQDHDIIYEITIPSAHVGIHPDNRAGEGVIPSECYSLVSAIYSHGWDEEQCDPIAGELPPPDSLRYHEIIKFNKKIVEDAAGMLPPYPDGNIKIISVTCSHNNQGNRIIFYEMPCEDLRIAENGKFSLHKIGQKEPLYATACTKGLTWRVVRYQFEDRFPRLMSRISEAKNAPQQIARTESRPEVLNKIQVIAKQYLDQRGLPIPWDLVERHAMRGVPPFKDEIPEMVIFVKVLSGGLSEPVLLHELQEFIKSLRRSIRVVTGAQYAAVAQVKVPPGTCMLFRFGVIKALLSASDKFATSPVVSLGDIASIGTKQLKFALQADNIQCEARKYADANGLEGSMKTTLMGLLDVRVVHHVFQRPDPSRGTFKSLASIGAALVSEHSSLTRQQHVMPPAFVETTIANKQAGASAPPILELQPAPIVEYTATGELRNPVQALNDEGFSIGTTVLHSKSEQFYDIVGMNAEGVTIQMPKVNEKDKAVKETVLPAHFLREYVFAKVDKKEPTGNQR
jgi:hypothetical protein